MSKSKKCSGAHGAEVTRVRGQRVVVKPSRAALCPVCFPNVENGGVK